MPDWLWWLSPVLVAPLAAAGWTAWAGRSRGPEHPDASMRAYERFRDALGSPLPSPGTATDVPASRQPASLQRPCGPVADPPLPVPTAARLPRQDLPRAAAQESSR